MDVKFWNTWGIGLDMHIHLKRVYEPPHSEDGRRVLVDRLWPRGLAKEAASIDVWMKEVAPSPELRKWFAHRPERFSEFCFRYVRELREDPVRRACLAQLRQWAEEGPVTLLYAAKDERYNHAVVLRAVLTGAWGDVPGGP